VLGLTAVTDEIDRELVTRSPVSSADHEHSWDDDVVARILDVAWSLAIESMAASQTETDASDHSVQPSAIKTTLKEIATYCCVPAETLACRWVRDEIPVTPEFSVDAFIDETTTAIYYHTGAGEDAYYHVADLVFEIIEPVVEQQDQMRDWLHGSLGKPEPLLKSYLASKDVSYQPLPVDSSPADQRRSAEGSSNEDGDNPAERSESTDNQFTTEEPAQSDDTGTQAGSAQVNSDAESPTGSQSESTQPDSVHIATTQTTTANGSNQSQTDTNESQADPSSSPRSNGHTTTADTSGSLADDSPFGNGAEGSHSSVQDELDAVSCLPQAATLTDALSSSNQGTHRPNETITTSPNSNPYALSTEPTDGH